MMNEIRFDDLKVGEKFKFASWVFRVQRGVCRKIAWDAYVVDGSNSPGYFHFTDVEAGVVKEF